MSVSPLSWDLHRLPLSQRVTLQTRVQARLKLGRDGTESSSLLQVDEDDGPGSVGNH